MIEFVFDVRQFEMTKNPIHLQHWWEIIICFQYKLGRIQNRLAFYYISYVLAGADDYLTYPEGTTKAHETIDQAIEIFKSVIVFHRSLCIIIVFSIQQYIWAMW